MGRKKISELQIAAILLPNATPAAIQNANLPICQLPAEILSYIFLFYKHSTMEDEIDKTKGLTQSNLNHDAVPYIAPSHVCSYWRHVVLSTPSFWSTLLLNHIGWGEELIRRSGRAPLDVHRHQLVKNGHNKTIFTRCLSQALQESHRIRSVDLTNAFQFQDFVLWKSVPQYFTKALEEIQISKLKSLILTELPSNVDWFTSFLSVTLAQSQGTIRELDLVMTVTSPIPRFASDSLATLRLRSIPPSELHAFVQQLGKLPRLESLVLVGSWSRLPPVFDPALMVQLPYLRELELTFDPETCDFILCHISGHQLRVLRILAAEKTPILVGGEYPLKLCRSIASLTVMSGDTVYPCVDLGIGDVSSVFSFVPEKSFKWSDLQHGGCVAPYRRLMSYDDSALDSGAPRTLSANSYGSMPQNSTVVISIPIGRQFSDTFRESLGTLWPALNHTKTVVLRGSPTITLEAYQRRMEIIFGMLSQLPTLEVLCIAGHHTGQHTIAKGFKIFDSLNGASNPAAPIFPKLRSIRLQGLIFNQASHNANGFGPFGYGVQHSPQLMIKEITCDDFISSIQWIKGVRASALQYISFKNCSHVGDEITESLEELGIFVERDRHSMR